MCLKFCETDYFGVHRFHKYVSAFLKKIPFCIPGRSNRDTLTHVVSCRQIDNFLLRYAPDCTLSSRKSVPRPTPSPRSVRYAPLGLVASLPRNRLCPPKCFGSLRSLHRAVPSHKSNARQFCEIEWDMAIQGGPERMQHLRSIISRKRGTE